MGSRPKLRETLIQKDNSLDKVNLFFDKVNCLILFKVVNLNDIKRYVARLHYGGIRASITCHKNFNNIWQL